MLVKMRRDATRDEVAAVEDKLHTLGFKTGKMVARRSRWSACTATSRRSP